MTYKRRHQIIRFIPGVNFDNVGAGQKALDIIKGVELNWEQRAELDDAVEDLWILIEKLETL